jgi:hypothetical protein
MTKQRWRQGKSATEPSGLGYAVQPHNYRKVIRWTVFLLDCRLEEGVEEGIVVPAVVPAVGVGAGEARPEVEEATEHKASSQLHLITTSNNHGIPNRPCPFHPCNHNILFP